MTEWRGLVPGVVLKEVATRGSAWTNCVVVRSEPVGLVFEVERAVADAGGDVENVRSTVLVPWTSVMHVVIGEQRS
jgi:hypothetical protein